MQTALDTAIAAAWVNDDPGLSALLSQRQELREAADPALQLQRLTFNLECLEDRVERHMMAAAHYAGRAEFRRLQGDAEQAAQDQIQADACTRCAERAQREADEVSAERDQLARRIDQAARLAGVA